MLPTARLPGLVGGRRRRKRQREIQDVGKRHGAAVCAICDGGIRCRRITAYFQAHPSSGQRRRLCLTSWTQSSTLISIHAARTRMRNARSTSPRRRKAELGGQKGILQSAVWKGASEMDQESARRGREGRACGDAHSCADGHASFPRLHISSGRNPVFERTDSVCRFKMECAFPVYGGYFRGKNR